MTNSLAKNSFILMLGRGTAFLISLATPLFLVRFLSVHDYGEYRQIILIIMSGGAILPLGMTFSLYYFLPHYPSEKDVYLSRTVVVIFMICCLFFLGTIYFNDLIADYFMNPNFSTYSPLIGLATLLLALSSIIETVLVVEKKVLLSSIILSLSTALRSVILIVTAMLGGMLTLLYGLVGFLGLKTVWSMFFLRSHYGISASKADFRNSLPHFKYAMPVAAGGILGNLTEVIDKFLVSHYLGAAGYAIYSTGCYEIPFIRIIFSSIGDVILPKIVSLKRENDIQGVIQLWQNAIEKSLLIGLPLFVFCFVFAHEIITTLFTQKYAESAPIFQIAVITILLESTRSGVITRAFARTSLSFYSSIISLAVMFPLCYFGIQKIGLRGAVWAVTIAKIIQTVLEFIYAKHLLKIKWTQVFPFRKTGVIGALSVVSVLAALLSNFAMQNSTLITRVMVLLAVFLPLYAYLTNRFRLWTIDSLPIPIKVRSLFGRFLTF